MRNFYPLWGQKIPIIAGIVATWYLIILVTKIPPYILPTPLQVVKAFYSHYPLILWHAALTFSQIGFGLIIASILGILMALLLDRYQEMQEWLRPVLLILQAMPSFILMPLLLIWFGFGIGPKMIVVCLSAFFPVTICFLDGLKRTPVEWQELTTVMQGTPWQALKMIRIPAALPGLLSGLRLAAIHAPLTVLAADWNGASHGLGYLIMLCHGRLQIDLMFACLFCTVFLTFILTRLIQRLEAHLIFWPA